MEPDLPADHLGRQAGGRVDPRREPGHACEDGACGRRGGVLVEHAGEVVGGIGQRGDEVDVAHGYVLVTGDRHVGPAARTRRFLTQRSSGTTRSDAGSAIGAWPRRSGDCRTTATPSRRRPAARRAVPPSPGPRRGPRREHPVAAVQSRDDVAQDGHEVTHRASGLGPGPANG